MVDYHRLAHWEPLDTLTGAGTSPERAVHLQRLYSALTAIAAARADCALRGELMLERLSLTIP